MQNNNRSNSPNAKNTKLAQEQNIRVEASEVLQKLLPFKELQFGLLCFLCPMLQFGVMAE